MWHSIPLTFYWFAYFGSLGVFYPYFTLYLRENAGLTGTQVGMVLAISPLIGMLAQPFWGQVADRTGARTRTLALLTLGTALGYLGLGYASGFASIVLATSALAVVGTAVFPLMTSVSLAILRDAGRHAFGRVRAAGTVGYFILILIFPWALTLHQPSTPTSAGVSQPGMGMMFPITATLVLVSAAIAFLLPQKGAVSLRAARGDWHELLHNRAFLRFLCFSLLAHFLMHGPMWLFPIFVRSRGGDLETIRNLWIIMLLVEIPLVFMTGSGLKRLGARGLLMAGVTIGGLRWVLSATISDPAIFFAVQALHGFMVVGLNIGSPLYLDLVAPEKLRSTAQGVLSMIGSGLAGILSNLASGWMVDHGGTNTLYLVCGVSSLTLGIVSCLILPKVQRRDDAPAAPALASETLT
jgi:PPP family 3-phenylpropionic acid transporter